MAPTNRAGSTSGAGLRAALGYFAVSVICGVLAASLVVPAVAGAGVALRESVGFFNGLPGELTVDPPSQSTKVLTADGKTIATFYSENRVKVGLEQMSPYIKDAIVAIEDRRAADAGGLDWQAQSVASMIAQTLADMRDPRTAELDQRLRARFDRLYVTPAGPPEAKERGLVDG